MEVRIEFRWSQIKSRKMEEKKGGSPFQTLLSLSGQCMETSSCNWKNTHMLYDLQNFLNVVAWEEPRIGYQ